MSEHRLWFQKYFSSPFSGCSGVGGSLSVYTRLVLIDFDNMISLLFID